MKFVTTSHGSVHLGSISLSFVNFHPHPITWPKRSVFWCLVWCLCSSLNLCRQDLDNITQSPDIFIHFNLSDTQSWITPSLEKAQTSAYLLLLNTCYYLLTTTSLKSTYLYNHDTPSFEHNMLN